MVSWQNSLKPATLCRAGKDAAVGNYDAVYQRGVKSFPGMGNLYLQRMETFRPQWGGSLKQMEAFVDEARASGAPPKTIEYLTATAAAVRNFEQWKGNPQKPAAELEAQIGRDLGGNAYENLALDLDRMASPASATMARDESVRLYPDATMPLVRRGYALLAKGDAKAAYGDFMAAANRGDYWALDRITTALTCGVDGISADQARLRSWVEYGVSISHGMSEQLLGTMYLQGFDGVTFDREKAIEYYRRAARHGYANGQHDLATVLLQTAKN